MHNSSLITVEGKNEKGTKKKINMKIIIFIALKIRCKHRK